MRTAVIGLGLAVAGLASQAEASEMIQFVTVSNTDVASFGIGQMRGNGTGTLQVTGLSGSISSAYLYWHGPTNLTSPTANASVMFGGSAITGTNIGFSDDNGWGYANSQAYRADVTSLITGNGAYALSGFEKGTSSPSGASIAAINGASLIVFYNDGNAANNRDVVLFNGNDSNGPSAYDRDNWNATLAGINFPVGGTATMTLHVSDGQNFGANDDGTLTINGTAFATGGLYQGTLAQTGNGSQAGTANNGGLWDVRTFDITSRLTPGSNTVTLTQDLTNDLLSLIVVQFNLPVGAAPPTPSVPEPATWAMMLAGFGAVGFAMRRRQRVAARVVWAG